MKSCKKLFAITFLFCNSMLMASCTLNLSVAKLYSEPRLKEGQAAYFRAMPVNHTSGVQQEAQFRQLDGLTRDDIYQTKEHFLDGSVNSRRDRTTNLFEILPGKHTVAIGWTIFQGNQGIWQRTNSDNAQSVEFEAKAGHIYSPEITVDQKADTFSAYVLDITDMDFTLKESILNSIKTSYPGTKTP